MENEAGNSFHYPFQTIAVCREPSGSGPDVLLAACGPRLYSLSLNDESGLISTWPESLVKEGEENSDSSTEIITTSPNVPKRGRKRKRKASSRDREPTGGTITRLCVSNDGKHVVALTAEDKSVHVFEIEYGKVKHVSQRHLQKRPCAAAITLDDKLILCGDKFGDVYGLPLHTPTEAGPPPSNENGHSNELPPRSYKPAANALTVHSQRNLKALENQIKHQPQTLKAKEPKNVDYELLLGHVSMLTDIATVTVSPPEPKGSSKRGARTYILTADRDEHIRISRGPPQAHVIEGYCLGHTQFVSKLCLPHPRILVSAGGDSHVFIWDWQDGKVLSRINLAPLVETLRATQGRWMGPEALNMQAPQRSNGDTTVHEHDLDQLKPGVFGNKLIAVSGLLALCEDKDTTEQVPTISILCTCESVPAVFKLSMPANVSKWPSEQDWILEYRKIPGNPLSLDLYGETIIVSIDHTQEFSKRKDAAHQNPSERLIAIPLSFSKGDLAGVSQIKERLDTAKGGRFGAGGLGLVPEYSPEEAKRLRDIIYSVENLRKRAGMEEE